MAYHPQTDGQTEHINQEIEQYLHIFINHHQNDWAEWLPLVEFSYNNKVQMSTGHTPSWHCMAIILTWEQILVERSGISWQHS